MLPTSLYQYRLALNTPIKFAGQTLSHRDGLLVKLEQDGQSAWGDCSPLPGFSHDSFEQNRTALTAFCHGQQGIESLPAAARFALDSARFLLTPRRQLAPQAVPLLAGDTEQQLAQFKALAKGTALVKLKLARAPVEQEIQLLHALLALNPKLRLRIDANRGWSYEDAATFAASVPLAQIDYVEEPCAELLDSLRLYQQHKLPLALDETTQAPDYQYRSLAGVKALVLKPTVIGSLARLQSLIEAAQHDGVRCVLSSSFESNLGLAAIAAIAAELTPDELPGLDTLRATAADLCQPNLWRFANQQAERPLIPATQLECLV
ncbi:o-succinylbenzoate synthase [Ferrimonas pelagia]|uniref:o-succinylbenzoate synthase n=1 Tax=Ferrimonas pelagia TaxID=1177826 RepID=A0ABP9ET45_9GAMM